MSGPKGHHSRSVAPPKRKTRVSLDGRHLTGSPTHKCEGYSAVAKPLSQLASIQLGSCLSLVDRCAP